MYFQFLKRPIYTIITSPKVSIREKIPQSNESKPIIKTDRESILEALEQCSGNRQKAAALLNMSRTTLWRRMKKYGIQ